MTTRSEARCRMFLPGIIEEPVVVLPRTRQAVKDQNFDPRIIIMIKPVGDPHDRLAYDRLARGIVLGEIRWGPRPLDCTRIAFDYIGTVGIMCRFESNSTKVKAAGAFPIHLSILTREAAQGIGPPRFVLVATVGTEPFTITDSASGPSGSYEQITMQNRRVLSLLVLEDS